MTKLDTSITTDIGAVAEAVQSIMNLWREIIDPKKQMARLNIKRRKWDQKAIDYAEQYIGYTESIEASNDTEIQESIKKKRNKAKEKFKHYN